MGKANKRADTKPEMALRSALHRRGHRIRKDYPIRVPDRRPIRPDIAFTRQRLAIFIDGCFWHRCDEQFVMPKSNTAYWGPKLEANVRRDRLVDDLLAEHGWAVIRIWEHTPIDEALAAIEPTLR